MKTLTDIQNSLIAVVHSLETPFYKDDITNVDRAVLENLIIATYDRLNEILMDGVDWWDIDSHALKEIRNVIFGTAEKI